MYIRIAKIGNSNTISFATDELKKYLEKIYYDILIDVCLYDKYDKDAKNLLWVGVDENFAIPEVNQKKYDDAISINVKKSCGYITGTNERSVLIAVYRFLRELGCDWVRPGKDGEMIPEKAGENINVSIFEKSSYRHRTICIEGSNAYQNVYDIIDWLPKVSMNGYFVQFALPFEFFKRYYNGEYVEKPEIPAVTKDDVAHFQKQLVTEIKKRSLLYHAVGHSWTCTPFGIDGGGWYNNTTEISEKTRSYLAELDGKRDFYKNVAINTQLCYSNPEVQEKMTDSITKYCIDNPEVDYLHLWLADDTNNHCECTNCKKMIPSDFYVQILNLLDEKMTLANISTKVVFLIYVDLLWEPQKIKFNNPDRFVLMFAPITRTYSKAFADFDKNEKFSLAPYERNKLVFSKNIGENVARLAKWQEQFKGDSFDFDYHLMWDHTFDMGYYNCAKLLFEDMRRLYEFNLDGMNSCQLQRVAFPTALPMYGMAKALWNREEEFEPMACSYFEKTFGKNGAKVKNYLSQISDMLNLPYLRGEIEATPEMAKVYSQIPPLVDSFTSEIQSNLNDTSLPTNVRKSWFYLTHHAVTTKLYANALEYKICGKKEKMNEFRAKILDYYAENRKNLEHVFDVELSPTIMLRPLN